MCFYPYGCNNHSWELVRRFVIYFYFYFIIYIRRCKSVSMCIAFDNSLFVHMRVVEMVSSGQNLKILSKYHWKRTRTAKSKAFENRGEAHEFCDSGALLYMNGRFLDRDFHEAIRKLFLRLALPILVLGCKRIWLNNRSKFVHPQIRVYSMRRAIYCAKSIESVRVKCVKERTWWGRKTVPG